MKKAILFAAFFLFAGLNCLVAQTYPINPIPSFNYQLSEPTTVFAEVMHGQPSREKREMDVVISSSSTHPAFVYGLVWVVKKNYAKILGPYLVFLDHKLEVPIDEGQWGVVIKCSFDVDASVWID
jgi:hypothetical protein